MPPSHQLNLLDAVERGDGRRVEDGLKQDSFEAAGLDARLALHRAAELGRADMVGWIVDAGVNVNATDDCGITALMLAARRDQQRAARALLERRANLEAADLEGWTALFHAAQSNHLGMVALLLESGANASVRDRLGRRVVQCARLYSFGLEVPEWLPVIGGLSVSGTAPIRFRSPVISLLNRSVTAK